MVFRPALFLAALAAAGSASCSPHPSPSASSAPAVSLAPAAPFAYYTCEVRHRWPHDPAAFTQGLLFLDDHTLLESTGMNGKSSLRRVDLATGRVLQQVDLPFRHFGEGVALLRGKVYQLTWKDHLGFIYDAATFEKQGEFSYQGEGWGLTTDGSSLILSDGTDRLRFLDPTTFTVQRSLHATHQGKPVDRLNELEFVDGQILANIWGADLIARIDPATGQSTGVIDCTALFPLATRATPEQVLNGIAWDPSTKRLLLTGKWWPEVFEVSLKPRP